MIAWLKKSWAWLVTVVVAAIAVIIWIASRRRSPWAAEKILEIQGDTEQKVEQIGDQAAAKQRKLDDAWKAKRKAIRQQERAQIEKLRKEGKRLNAAAIKRRTLEGLDDPL